MKVLIKKNDIPVSRDCHKSEYTSTHWDDRNEWAYFAVDISEGPVAVEHVHKVEGDVEGGHHGVRNAQVNWKKIKHY